MGMGFKHFPTKTFTKAILKMVCFRDAGSISGLMELILKEHIKMD